MASRVLESPPGPRRRHGYWTSSIQGAVDEARSWTWDEFTALPAFGVPSCRSAAIRRSERAIVRRS
jgi:hypothetical protein